MRQIWRTAWWTDWGTVQHWWFAGLVVVWILHQTTCEAWSRIKHHACKSHGAQGSGRIREVEFWAPWCFCLKDHIEKYFWFLLVELLFVFGRDQKTWCLIKRHVVWCLVITRHVSPQQDMSCEHKTCLVITRHVLWSRNMSCDHKTCLVITRHVLWSQDMSPDHKRVITLETDGREFGKDSLTFQR